jgi:hypothetical protein
MTQSHLFLVPNGAFVLFVCEGQRRKRTRSPGEPSASSALQEYLRSKKKNEAYPEDAVTSL